MTANTVIVCDGNGERFTATRDGDNVAAVPGAAAVLRPIDTTVGGATCSAVEDAVSADV